MMASSGTLSGIVALSGIDTIGGPVHILGATKGLDWQKSITMNTVSAESARESIVLQIRRPANSWTSNSKEADWEIHTLTASLH